MSKIEKKGKSALTNSDKRGLKNKLIAVDEVETFGENIFDTVREPLLLLDKKLRVVKASRSFYAYFTLNSEETIGTLIYNLGNHQFDIPRLRELLETILPEKTKFDNYEVEHVFPLIGKRIMILNARQIKRVFGKETGILLAIEDITGRKRKEEGLSETNHMIDEYLDVLFNHAHAPIIIWDASLVITRINRAFEKLCGYNWSEIKEKKIDILFPKDKIESTLELINNTLLSDERSDIIEIDILTKNKDIKTVLWNPANIYDKKGNQIVATIVQDITKRKKTEEALVILEARYRRLFESAQEGILILNGETGKIIDVNPFLIELLGYSKEQLVDKEIWEVGFLKEIAANYEKYLELLQNKYVRYEDLQFETSNGRKINVEFVSNVYLVDLCKVVQCNIRDITERKKIEQKVLESEMRFKTIFNQSPIAIALLDKQGHPVISNPPLSQMTGYSSAELSEMKFSDFTYPEDIDKDMKQFTDLVDGKISKYRMEKRFIKKNGKLVWINLFATKLHNENAVSLEVLGMAEDITERKQAEESLRESEEKFRIITEESADAIFIVDNHGKYLYVNNKVTQMLGYSKEEMLTFEIANISPNNKLEEYLQIFQHLLQEGSYFSEIELVKKDGTIISTDFNAVVLPNGSIYASCRDITKRKIIENENLLLAESLRTINECVSITDIEDKIVFVNESFQNTYYYDEKDLVGKDISIVRSLRNRPELVNKIFPTTISGRWQGELWNKRSDGSEFQISLSTTVVKTKEGKILGMIGVATDITERKRAEEALIKSEKEFRNLAEAMPQIVWITQPDGWNIYFSQQWVDYTGMTLEESYGHGWNKPFHPDDQQQAWDAWQNATKNNGIYSIESRIRRADGIYNWFLVRGVPISDANGTILKWFGTCTDINEIKHKEKELIEAKEKAEVMNRLKSSFLANMSHELRTPLIGINGFADFLRQDISDPELKEMAESIFASGTRLSQTLNDILDLSKLESEIVDIKLQKMDLVVEANSVLNLFKVAAREKGLTLKSTFSQPAIFIETDTQSIRSIFNNLISNAIKFTHKGGIVVDLSLNAKFVEIKVIDSGIGISKEYYQIIFDEFRQVSEGYNRNFGGTGLGLYITKKLVKRLGGEISIESEHGKGSVFIVSLPVINIKEIKVEKIEKSIIKRIIVPEKIAVKSVALLVDDDPYVYAVLKRYLREWVELEYTDNGDSSVKLCLNKQFDFIFVDINLGHQIDGKQVTGIIRKIKGYESIPIIAVTAYAMVGNKEEFLAAGCSHYISKPFTQESVFSLLEEIMDGDLPPISNPLIT